VEVKVRPQYEFQKLIRDNLEVCEELIAYTYKMSQQFVDRIETLSAQSAAQKVVSMLKYLSNKAGTKQAGKIKLNVPLTSQEIADLCSLTRETASVQLVKLKKSGVISGRRYLVINETELTKLVEV
jgi:CRP-like cAMP-binding protein